MYVIAEIQGQQFKIEEGMKLFVHHIQDVEAGANVEFDKILLADKDGQVTVSSTVTASSSQSFWLRK